MPDEYVLAVGLYANERDALTDLRDLTNPGPIAEVLAGTAVLSRDHGALRMQQIGGGATAFGIGTGAAAGVTAGSLLGMPFSVMALGAILGGLLGRQVRRRESSQLFGLLADDLSAGQTALVMVLPEKFLYEAKSAMVRARKVTGRVIGDASARRLARGLVRGNPDATDALAEDPL